MKSSVIAALMSVGVTMPVKKIIGILVVLALTGCALPPQLNFSPPDVRVSKTKIDAEVKTITVTSAHSYDAKGKMPYDIKIATSMWQDSLQEAIDRMAIFKDDSRNKISIQVKVLALDIPAFGASMNTKSIARYEIIDRSNGFIVYTQDISADGFVPFNYAFLGPTRGRESINRSIQNNIQQFLQALEVISKPMFPSEKPT